MMIDKKHSTNKLINVIITLGGVVNAILLCCVFTVDVDAWSYDIRTMSPASAAAAAAFLPRRTMTTTLLPLSSSMKATTTSKTELFFSLSRHSSSRVTTMTRLCTMDESGGGGGGTATTAQDYATSSSTSNTETTPTRTRYTIDDSVCPPTRSHILQGSVHKACENFDKYKVKKPFAAHTVAAYDKLVARLKESTYGNDTEFHRPVVLDSGCGTGRSTRYLATSFPDHWVIGVDRSFLRISRNNKTTNRRTDDDCDSNVDDTNNPLDLDVVDATDDQMTNDQPRGDGDPSSFSSSSERAYIQQIAPNAFLVRAELVDFWRCCYRDRLIRDDDDDDRDDVSSGENGSRSISNDGKNEVFKWDITHHYMLYPNPYPTNQRLTQRWYAHPSFPLLMMLGAQTMVVRSNWEGYLKEFAAAIRLGHDFYGNNEERRSKKTDGGRQQHQQQHQQQNNPVSRYIESARLGPFERTDKTIALTNFEAKYDKIGESTYELLLQISDMESVQGDDIA